MAKNDDKKQQSKSEDHLADESEDYGYYYYPERRKSRTENRTLWSKFTAGRSAGRTLKCVANVHECARKG